MQSGAKKLCVSGKWGENCLLSLLAMEKSSFRLGAVFRQMYLLLLLAAAPALLAAWLHPRAPDWDWRNAPPGEGMVTFAALPAPMDAITWIDARSHAAFSAAHIPGAVLLNEDEWEALFFDAIDALADPQPIVVYCGDAGCQASERVAERLRNDLAREDIYVLHRGWEAWLEWR